jgi:MSHA biogenesis protein MshL
MFNQEILIDLEIAEFINTKDINRGVDWQKLFNDVKLFGNSGVVSIKQNLAPTLGGGIELTYHGADFSAFLAALSQQGYTRVVSSPRITTLNNQPALIKVGNDRILIYTKVESENTTTQNVSNSISSVSVERTPIVSEGLSLLVYPRYNEYSKTIILNITSILQKLSGKGSKDLDTQLANMVIADPSRFQTKPVPLNIETKQLNAVAKLKDGDVLVLGGLSSEVNTKERSFVPLLGEVPILRELFSNTKDERIKSFLILLLRVKKL